MLLDVGSMLDYYCLPISIVSIFSFFSKYIDALVSELSNFFTENTQICRDKNVKPNTKILSFLKSQSLKIKTNLINNLK
jgi:hypothetical protein